MWIKVAKPQIALRYYVHRPLSQNNFNKVGLLGKFRNIVPYTVNDKAMFALQASYELCGKFRLKLTAASFSVKPWHSRHSKTAGRNIQRKNLK